MSLILCAILSVCFNICIISANAEEVSEAQTQYRYIIDEVYISQTPLPSPYRLISRKKSEHTTKGYKIVPYYGGEDSLDDIIKNCEKDYCLYENAKPIALYMANRYINHKKTSGVQSRYIM